MLKKKTILYKPTLGKPQRHPSHLSKKKKLYYKTLKQKENSHQNFSFSHSKDKILL